MFSHGIEEGKQKQEMGEQQTPQTREPSLQFQ